MAINNTLKDIREERNLIQADLAEAKGSYVVLCQCGIILVLVRFILLHGLAI